MSKAFHLMWYACPSCGHRTRAWNGWNGTPPAIVTCPSCCGLLQHVDSHLDQKMVSHKPWPGQLVFTRLSLEEAREQARKRLVTLGLPPDHEGLEELALSMYGDGRTAKSTYYVEPPPPLTSLNSVVVSVLSRGAADRVAMELHRAAQELLDERMVYVSGGIMLTPNGDEKQLTIVSDLVLRWND